MRWICILMAVVLFSIPARADDAPDSAKLIGSWKLPSKDMDEVMTFAKDGTFTQHVKMGDMDQSMSGTWKLEGKTLTETVTKASMPERVGQAHKLTVTSLTDDKLVMQDGPDKEDEIALERVKDK